MSRWIYSDGRIFLIEWMGCVGEREFKDDIKALSSYLGRM